jgi:tetratricopeptide (TPR) repeat protein
VTLSADELYRRGVEHCNAGRNATARRALETALRRTTDADLRARIAGTMSYIAARTGDPDGAEQLCLDALAGEGVSPASAAVLEGQVGLLALGRGEFDRAVSWLSRGIAGVGDDPERRNAMYLNRSVAHMQARRLAEARSDLEHAAADLEVVGDAQGLAMVRHNAGYLSLLEGELVQALQQMGSARAVFQAESPISAAISDLDRAEVLRDAGLVTEAERTLAEVARVFGAHRMRQSRGEAEYNLARSLLLHDPARAAKVAGAAARRFRALGSESWAARAEGVRLCAVLRRPPGGRASGRTVAPSAEEILTAATELDRLGFPHEAATLHLTRELWLAEHMPPPRAAERQGDVRPSGEPPATTLRLPRNTPLQVRLLARQVRAVRASVAGRNAEARRHAAEGLDLLTQWQAAFGSLDLQTSVAVHATGLLTAGLASALRSNRPDAIFEWSERTRHLTQQVVPLRPPPDPELASDLAELRALRAENPDWLSSPAATLIAERARHRQWTATGAAGRSDQVSLDELQTSLEADTAFVSYLFDGRRFGCLVVTRDETKLVAAPDPAELDTALAGLRADLDVSASVRTGPLATVIARALEERLAELARVLLRAPLAVAGDRRLVLTAPGVLAGVPWPMLPGLRGRPFTLAISATTWVRERSRVRRAGAGFAAGPGVARGVEEVGRASVCWPAATTITGEAATVTTVTGLAGEVGVLHLAAHGRHAVDNPLFSGLELADGTLFGYDIDQMPQVPDVVILSACELGRSTVRWGEEAIGMTRAWLHAGAGCVIATPVVVADDLACELLGAMHTELAAGHPPSEALARAGVRTGVNAPFQCHGSGF